MADRRAHDPFAPHPALRAVPNPEPTKEPETQEPRPTDELDGLLKTELVDIADRMDLTTSGTKEDLITRIERARRNRRPH